MSRLGSRNDWPNCTGMMMCIALLGYSANNCCSAALGISIYMYLPSHPPLRLHILLYIIYPDIATIYIYKNPNIPLWLSIATYPDGYSPIYLSKCSFKWIISQVSPSHILHRNLPIVPTHSHPFQGHTTGPYSSGPKCQL